MPCLLATAWAWLKTLACKSHARWLEQGEKELSLRDLAAKAQRQQQRNKLLKLLVVSQLRQSTTRRTCQFVLKRFAAAAETQLRVDAHVTNPFRPFDYLRDTFFSCLCE